MMIHRDRRVTPPGTKRCPPLRGRPENEAGETAPSSFSHAGGMATCIIAGSVELLARATSPRCAVLLAAPLLRTITIVAVIGFGPYALIG